MEVVGQRDSKNGSHWRRGCQRMEATGRWYQKPEVTGEGVVTKWK